MFDEIKDLLMKEDYDTSVIKCKELLDNNTNNPELWYLLFLSCNNNLIDVDFDNLNNQLAFNKALECADSSLKKLYSSEYNITKLLNKYANLSKLLRYAQYYMYYEFIVEAIETTNTIINPMSEDEQKQFLEYITYIVLSPSYTDCIDMFVIYLLILLNKNFFTLEIQNDLFKLYIEIKGDSIAAKYDDNYNSPTVAKCILQFMLDYDKTVELPNENNDYNIFMGLLIKYNGTSKIIHIPEEVEEIYEYAFAGNKTINEVIIHDNIRILGEECFGHCINLKRVTLPKSELIIGFAVFNECINLRSINIEDKTIIAPQAFSGCPLDNIMISENNPHYKLLIIDKIEDSIVGCILENNTKMIKAINLKEIPKIVDIIGCGAFECSEITSIEIPGNVKTIESYSFFECKNLKEVYLSKDIVTIEDNVFGLCRQIEFFVEAKNKPTGWADNWNCNYNNITWDYKSINLKDFIISEDFNSCYIKKYNGKAKYLEIPYFISRNRKISTIFVSAFYQNYNLVKVVINEGITTICDDSFYHCHNLKEIYIPSTVRKIASSAFDDCPNLEKIYVDPNNHIYSSTENNNILIEKSTSKLIAATNNSIIPKYIKEINYGNNITCSILNIPEGLISIGDYAFSNNQYIEEIIFPEINCQIGEKAFGDMQRLRKIVIPKSVTYIDSEAFTGCKGLTIYFETEKLPSNWERFDDENIKVVCGYGIKKEPDFNYNLINEGICITKYNGTESSITIPSTIDNKIVLEIGDDFLKYKLNINTVKLPNLINKIGKYSFYNTSLNSIIFFDNIKEIGEYAFSNTQLEKIYLPRGLSILGVGAFSNCQNLKEVKIDKNIKIIPDFAFKNCTNLQKIILYNSIKRISWEAFVNCNRIEKVVFYGTQDEWNNILFDDKTIFGSKTKRLLEKNIIFMNKK